jgi:hypothetical protein
VFPIPRVNSARNSIIYNSVLFTKAKIFQVIGFPPIFGESYRSHVSLFEPNLVTAVSTDLTLFRHLKSVWKFQDNVDFDTVDNKSIDDKSKTCLLDFAVSFQFRFGFGINEFAVCSLSPKILFLVQWALINHEKCDQSDKR